MDLIPPIPNFFSLVVQQERQLSTIVPTPNIHSLTIVTLLIQIISYVLFVENMVT